MVKPTSFVIKGDIGDSCEDLANVVDGDMTLGDSIILTPVDFHATGDLSLELFCR
jgi:hypothetical protein